MKLSGIFHSAIKEKNNLTDPVLLIAQDADRLDAIGAIGIARAFTYGGYKKNAIFNPEEDKDMPSTIMHFYDKLLILKEKMNTGTAKIIQKKDIISWNYFLMSCYKEWEYALPLKNKS